ncbi:hypothetical protein OIU78_013559 [Salix suchowensis]|nr:hypothetical protein OIU78_013559 [Salix suchowensis]
MGLEEKLHHPGTGKVRNYMDTKQVAVSPFLRATRRKSLVNTTTSYIYINISSGRSFNCFFFFSG